ncbi:MAG: Hint domain-containing protein [Paenirhodobacter sp.]|uniref:Hint domain-containing protein n=1 Tax=Paenirhodobacter sp. TaxID=1965326 RepID=UPI003D098AEE
MATTYIDQFYVMDPANPPAAGTLLDPVQLEITDRNNDDWLSTGARDRIDGQKINQVWVNDTITVTGLNGVTHTITGVTFYLADGRAVFTPTDGSILHNASFVSSSYVTSATQTPVSSLGPPCFVAGTRILTPAGERPVEWLRPGDEVVTQDAGARPILWVGSRSVAGTGAGAPVRFAPGAVGNRRALLVSQQHRMLVTGWQAELHCGASEVLVAAKHLVNGTTIRLMPCATVSYHHLMLDAHHLLTAEGAASESFFPGDTILEGDRRLAAEIAAVSRALGPGNCPQRWQTARKVARGAELSCVAA